MLQRLINNWVYGGFLAGLLLLFLTPALAPCWRPAFTATFLLLPFYMLHQFEEHDQDRFRLMFNRTFGRNQEILSREAVFLINVPGVWGVIVLSLTLAAFCKIGFSLIAVYLVLVNAVVHLIHAIIFRSYNPGLYTAILLFLPSGIAALVLVNHEGGGTLGFQALGLLVSVSIHAAIVIHARLKLRSK